MFVVLKFGLKIVLCTTLIHCCMFSIVQSASVVVFQCVYNHDFRQTRS